MDEYVVLWGSKGWRGGWRMQRRVSRDCLWWLDKDLTVIPATPISNSRLVAWSPLEWMDEYVVLWGQQGLLAMIRQGSALARCHRTSSHLWMPSSAISGETSKSGQPSMIALRWNETFWYNVLASLKLIAFDPVRIKLKQTHRTVSTNRLIQLSLFEHQHLWMGFDYSTTVSDQLVVFGHIYHMITCIFMPFVHVRKAQPNEGTLIIIQSIRPSRERTSLLMNKLQ